MRERYGTEPRLLRLWSRLWKTRVDASDGVRHVPSEETRLIPASINAIHQHVHIDEAMDRIGTGPFQRRILMAAGLCFMADSMEILLLSFLAVVLQQEWHLTTHQMSMITSSVFVGALVGTLMLGRLGDRVGRQPIFRATAALIAIFGLLTAFARSFISLLFYRLAVGFGVGGLTVPFDVLAEFAPASARGTSLLAIEYFWTGGTLLVPLLAYLCLEKMDGSWRLFVALCAVPCGLSTLLGILYVPESPRWLLTQGRHEQALAVLRDVACINGKDPWEMFPAGMRLVDDTVGESSNVLDLLQPKLRKTMLFLWTAWTGFTFVYYGNILVITLVFSSQSQAPAETTNSGAANNSFSFDYSAIFVSASSELAGLTLVMHLIDRIGRIPSQTASYVGGGISVGLLCLLAARQSSYGSATPFMVMTAFLARMCYMSGTCSSWVSTAELLPTEVRSTGHAAANAVARFGSIACPFLVTDRSSYFTIGWTLLTVSCMTAWCTWNLPETRGLRLGELHL